MYHIARHYCEFLLGRLGAGDGKDLERLADYLVGAMPGCRPLSVFASRLAAITQLPDRAAPRTAGRSVLVMAAVSGDFFAQREDYETNETRRLEDSKEVTDR